MTPEQAMVDEFHEKFGLQRPCRFDFAGLDGDHRISLMQEELDEFKEAWFARDVEGMVDAMCDLLYVVHGTSVAAGVDLEPFFRIVHAANMAKLGPDGKPILREDGKLLKPPGWTPPDHTPLLRRPPLYFRPNSNEVESLRRALKETERAGEDIRLKNGALLEENRLLREKLAAVAQTAGAL